MVYFAYYYALFAELRDYRLKNKKVLRLKASKYDCGQKKGSWSIVCLGGIIA